MDPGYMEEESVEDDTSSVLVSHYHMPSADDVPYIYEAMDHWSTKTCVKFETYSSDRSSTLGHNQRLRFHKADGCWSYVGRQPTNRMQPQPISIGTGCLELGTIAHEIGHAMGFQHEQSRPDRDDHVEVFWTNIETDQQNNFEKESLEDVMASEVVKYDLKSVMHYGPYVGCVNNMNQSFLIFAGSKP
eukprot:XP_003727490.1 PREDICTED: blastula protease 10 [Strongylocentrotus purpuratus]